MKSVNYVFTYFSDTYYILDTTEARVSKWSTPFKCSDMSEYNPDSNRSNYQRHALFKRFESGLILARLNRLLIGKITFYRELPRLLFKGAVFIVYILFRMRIKEWFHVCSFRD